MREAIIALALVLGGFWLGIGVTWHNVEGVREQAERRDRHERKPHLHIDAARTCFEDEYLLFKWSGPRQQARCISIDDLETVTPPR